MLGADSKQMLDNSRYRCEVKGCGWTCKTPNEVFSHMDDTHKDQTPADKALGQACGTTVLMEYPAGLERFVVHFRRETDQKVQEDKDFVEESENDVHVSGSAPIACHPKVSFSRVIQARRTSTPLEASSGQYGFGYTHLTKCLQYSRKGNLRDLARRIETSTGFMR